METMNINSQVVVEKKNNKTQQELQDFLYYIVQTSSIIDPITSFAVSDKSLLIKDYKEPGRKKLEFLCKHILSRFDVTFNNTQTKESCFENVIQKFKEFTSSQKKPRKKRVIQGGQNSNESIKVVNIEEHVISFDIDFSIELTEEDLSEFK